MTEQASAIPQWKAIALRLDWTGKKFGDHPRRIVLGEFPLPDDTFLEDAEALVRKQYPSANWAQFLTADGSWWASTSL